MKKVLFQSVATSLQNKSEDELPSAVIFKQWRKEKEQRESNDTLMWERGGVERG